MKFSRRSFPCDQIMNPSSINLIQTGGLNGAFSIACCSNLPMNKLANEVAMQVPIAVPCTCKNCSLLNEKLFIVRIILMPGHICVQ